MAESCSFKLDGSGRTVKLSLDMELEEDFIGKDLHTRDCSGSGDGALPYDSSISSMCNLDSKDLNPCLVRTSSVWERLSILALVLEKVKLAKNLGEHINRLQQKGRPQRRKNSVAGWSEKTRQRANWKLYKDIFAENGREKAQKGEGV